VQELEDAIALQKWLGVHIFPCVVTIGKQLASLQNQCVRAHLRTLTKHLFAFLNDKRVLSHSYTQVFQQPTTSVHVTSAQKKL
jgi:hypothetical protein